MFKKLRRITAAVISLAAICQISSVNVVGAEAELLYSTDFENEEVCWYAFGNTNSIELSNDFSNSGEYSLKASKRTQPWMGPGIEITEYLEDGPQYTVSFMAYQTASSSNASIKATAKVYYESGGDDFISVLSDQSVPPEEWTQIKGTLELKSGITKVELYIETMSDSGGGYGNYSGGNFDFYIDDFALYSGVDDSMMPVQTEAVIVSESDPVEITDKSDDTVVIDNKKEVKKKKKNNAMIPVLITATLLVAALGVAAYVVLGKKPGSPREDSEKDQLTKAYLKEKFDDRIKEFQNTPEKLNEKYFSICEIINMQKITADFGQAHGDEALMKCAYLLQKAADKHGKIYRVSNERFVVISDRNIKNEIKQEIENEKKEHKNYDIQIAFGYSYFDKKNDGIPNVRVILDRAETMMLSDKNRINAAHSAVNESHDDDEQDILKTLENVKTID